MEVSQQENPAASQPEIPSPTTAQLTGEVPVQPQAIAWEQHIPESYKDQKCWEPHKGKGLESVLQNYAEVQQLIGRSIQLPKDNTDTDAWQKIYKKLGRPESHEQYEYDPPEIEGVDWEKEGLPEFKKKAHELGLNQAQTKGILDWNASFLMNQQRENTTLSKQELDNAQKELKDEYKTNYTFTEALIDRYLETKFTNEDDAKDLKILIRHRPEMFRSFAKEAQVMNEAGSFGKVSPGDFGGLTYETAQAKIREVNTAGRDHPYWDSKHPDHNAAVAEAQTWYAVKKPSHL